MSEPKTRLGPRFQEALSFAFDCHRTQVRKGSGVPYISHLLSVSALVMEHGGSEDEAIAALLHDAAEDHGGESMLSAIRSRFGGRVAELVRGCSDTLSHPKPPWEERKRRHLDRLRGADADVLLIALADKVHNARTIVEDLREAGSSLWSRFQGGREGTLWYYNTLLDLFRTRNVHPALTRILAAHVGEMNRLAALRDDAPGDITGSPSPTGKNAKPDDLRPARPPVLLGIPFDRNASFRRGPALAPLRIREALRCGSMNLTAESGRHLRPDFSWKDAGDLVFGRRDTPEEVNRQIEDRVRALLSETDRILVLGGDHSITYPVLRALSQKYDGLAVLHLDAHPDLYPALDGNPFSHGSVFSRVLEEGLVTRLVQVGVRTLNASQKAQAQRFGVEIFPAHRWRDALPFRFDGFVYLSIDVDCLDPAFAPGVSHFEPGGLSTRDVLEIVHHLEGRLVGADIVEINPDRDLQGITAALGAKLVKEVLARFLDEEEQS